MPIAEKAAERAGVLAVRLTNAEQRIARLEEALRAVVNDVNDYERVKYREG